MKGFKQKPPHGIDLGPIGSVKEFKEMMDILKELPVDKLQALGWSGGEALLEDNEIHGRYEQQLARIANRLGDIVEILKEKL